MSGLKVKPFESGRFHVTSERDASMVYLVDVMENNGRGCCDCEDYRIRIEAGGEQRRCKHQVAVAEWLGWMVIREMIANEKLRQDALQ